MENIDYREPSIKERFKNWYYNSRYHNLNRNFKVTRDECGSSHEFYMVRRDYTDSRADFWLRRGCMAVGAAASIFQFTYYRVAKSPDPMNALNQGVYWGVAAALMYIGVLDRDNFVEDAYSSEYQLDSYRRSKGKASIYGKGMTLVKRRQLAMNQLYRNKYMNR